MFQSRRESFCTGCWIGDIIFYMKDHHKIFGGFAFFMILLFVAWVISGGPERALESGSAHNPYQDSLAPLRSGETYRSISNPPAAPNPSLYGQ